MSYWKMERSDQVWEGEGGRGRGSEVRERKQKKKADRLLGCVRRVKTWWANENGVRTPTVGGRGAASAGATSSVLELYFERRCDRRQSRVCLLPVAPSPSCGGRQRCGCAATEAYPALSFHRVFFLFQLRFPRRGAFFQSFVVGAGFVEERNCKPVIETVVGVLRNSTKACKYEKKIKVKYKLRQKEPWSGAVFKRWVWVSRCCWLQFCYCISE